MRFLILQLISISNHRNVDLITLQYIYMYNFSCNKLSDFTSVFNDS